MARLPKRRIFPLFLAAGALGAQVPTNLALEAMQRDLMWRATGHGWNEQTGFTALDCVKDPQGTLHGRFQQTHDGRRVWGAQILTRLDPAQGPLPPTASPYGRLSTVPQAILTSQEAVSRVLKEMNLPGNAHLLAPITTEAVVFPTACTGTVVYEAGPQEGLYRMDPLFSVLEDPPAEAHVPAFVVHSRHWIPGRGEVARDTVVEARSGRILRKDQGWHFAGPVKVNGLSQYAGTVTLDGYEQPDGTFILQDTTRPRAPHALQNTVLGPGLPPSTFVYLKANNPILASATPVRTTALPFGDGLRFNYLNPWNEAILSGLNGQTAAVDVAFGLQTTWDMMKQVLGREGPDGGGGALAADVHANLSMGSPYANAFWDPAQRTLSFGDGGGTYLPFTSLDVVAHEMGHALMSSTANLTYSGESGALSEANSDIIAMAALCYASGGHPLTTPTDFPWTIGGKVDARGTPFRSLKRPSANYAPEGWYDGIEITSVHQGAGPANRFFYYLSAGCTPTDPDAASPYLPAGMTGIGIAKALQIWYRALTTKIADPNTGYAGMRTATLAAAQELHGNSSPEVAAVANAWTAVAVGPPHGTTHAPTLLIEPGPWPGGLSPAGISSSKSRELYVNVGGAVPLPKAKAEHFPTTPTLVWTSPFADVDETAGVLHTSTWNMLGWNFSFDVKVAGTPYMARTMVNPVVLDLNGDGEADASDAATLAIYAMSGRLGSESWDPATLQHYLPPDVAIYRWNRAFEALVATGGK